MKRIVPGKKTIRKLDIEQVDEECFYIPRAVQDCYKSTFHHNELGKELTTIIKFIAPCS